MSISTTETDKKVSKNAEISEPVVVKKTKKTVNEALFRPSEWDDYPLKRDDKHTNKIVQPDFAPFCDVTKPEALPDSFQFSSIDVRDENSLKRMCNFLNANYKYTFVFDTTHVRWALDVPVANFPRSAEVLKGCVICVHPTSSPDKLVGLIASRPITYRVDGRVICTLEVAWLCTLQVIRGKRLASVLMKELYRRAYVWGISVGMLFTIPRQLPALFTVGTIKMVRRVFTSSDAEAIHPNKNIDLVRFANLRDVSRMMKIYRKYAADQENSGWRLHREYNRREFEHTFLRRGDVMTYVIRTDRGDVKDFVSLYSLTESGSSSTEPTKTIAYIQFISFLNDKLLELFMQNVLFIMHRNKFSAVYIADLGGVGETLRTKLGFEDVPENMIASGYMYQFNYNTNTIDAAQSTISPMF
jgi:GNAT superfamily N-acetyltransferase